MMLMMTTTMMKKKRTKNDRMAGRKGRTEEFGKWNCAKNASRAGTETHARALAQPAQPGMSRIGPDGHRTSRTLSGPPRPWGSPRRCEGCEERKTLRSRSASRTSAPILEAGDWRGYRVNCGDGGRVPIAT